MAVKGSNEPIGFENQSMSLKSLMFLSGSVVTPIVVFFVVSVGQLNGIKTELILLRRDVNSLQTDNLPSVSFRRWVQVFRASNPELNVPPALDD